MKRLPGRGDRKSTTMSDMRQALNNSHSYLFAAISHPKKADVCILGLGELRKGERPEPIPHGGKDKKQGVLARTVAPTSALMFAKSYALL